MKVFCWFGRHSFRDAQEHPDRGLGFHIAECCRCETARVREGGSDWHPILSTRDAVLRDANKAAKLLPISVDEWTPEQRDVVRKLVSVQGLPTDLDESLPSPQRRLLAWEGHHLKLQIEQALNSFKDTNTPFGCAVRLGEYLDHRMKRSWPFDSVEQAEKFVQENYTSLGMGPSEVRNLASLLFYGWSVIKVEGGKLTLARGGQSKVFTGEATSD